MIKNPLSLLPFPVVLMLLALYGCHPKDLKNVRLDHWQKAVEAVKQHLPIDSNAASTRPVDAGKTSWPAGPAPGTTSTPTPPLVINYPSTARSGILTSVPTHPAANIQWQPAPPLSVREHLRNFPIPSDGSRGFGFPGVDARPIAGTWFSPDQQGRWVALDPQAAYGHPSARLPFDSRSLVIGTFNIQTFGRAKLGNSSVQEIIVEMIRRFDLIAIQELRSTEQSIIPMLVESLNAKGMEFGFWVGERQGETISKEQYVYIYDTKKLRLISEPFITRTRTPMHRPPLAAWFQVITLPPNQASTFCLLNVHTDPDQVKPSNRSQNELLAIREAVGYARASLPLEDDFIVLGDFNAPTEFMASEYPWFERGNYVVRENWVTNVRENRNYDNIVFDQQATTEWDGRGGVFNFRREFNLSLEDALSVSDHFPVWATFSIFENAYGGEVAALPASGSPR